MAAILCIVRLESIKWDLSLNNHALDQLLVIQEKTQLQHPPLYFFQSSVTRWNSKANIFMHRGYKIILYLLYSAGLADWYRTPGVLPPECFWVFGTKMLKCHCWTLLCNVRAALSIFTCSMLVISKKKYACKSVIIRAVDYFKLSLKHRGYFISAATFMKMRYAFVVYCCFFFFLKQTWIIYSPIHQLSNADAAAAMQVRGQISYLEEASVNAFCPAAKSSTHPIDMATLELESWLTIGLYIK